MQQHQVIHNPNMTVYDFLWRQQIVSDDYRGNEGGIYVTGANHQRLSVSQIYLGRKIKFTSVYLMIRGQGRRAAVGFTVHG